MTRTLCTGALFDTGLHVGLLSVFANFQSDLENERLPGVPEDEYVWAADLSAADVCVFAMEKSQSPSHLCGTSCMGAF